MFGFRVIKTRITICFNYILRREACTKTLPQI